MQTQNRKKKLKRRIVGTDNGAQMNEIHLENGVKSEAKAENHATVDFCTVCHSEYKFISTER